MHRSANVQLSIWCIQIFFPYFVVPKRFTISYTGLRDKNYLKKFSHNSTTEQEDP